LKGCVVLMVGTGTSDANFHSFQRWTTHGFQASALFFPHVTLSRRTVCLPEGVDDLLHSASLLAVLAEHQIALTAIKGPALRALG